MAIQAEQIHFTGSECYIKLKTPATAADIIKKINEFDSVSYVLEEQNNLFIIKNDKWIGLLIKYEVYTGRKTQDDINVYFYYDNPLENKPIAFTLYTQHDQ